MRTSLRMRLLCCSDNCHLTILTFTFDERDIRSRRFILAFWEGKYDTLQGYEHKYLEHAAHIKSVLRVI